jgi:hypothetical protein
LPRAVRRRLDVQSQRERQVFGNDTSAQVALQTPSLSGDVTDGYTGTITIGTPA